jgi:hypothetical protein
LTVIKPFKFSETLPDGYCHASYTKRIFKSVGINPTGTKDWINNVIGAIFEAINVDNMTVPNGTIPGHLLKLWCLIIISDPRNN